MDENAQNDGRSRDLRAKNFDFVAALRGCWSLILRWVGPLGYRCGPTASRANGIDAKTDASSTRVLQTRDLWDDNLALCHLRHTAWVLS